MEGPCTFCGREVADHEPVTVETLENREVVSAGRFCNYACLARHIEAAGLETGACCHIDLS